MTIASGFLVCPACHVPLPTAPASEIHCAGCGKVYPVRDGIPWLIDEDRRKLFDDVALTGPSQSAMHLTEQAVLQANMAYHAAHADQYEDDPSTEQVFSPAAASRIGEVAALARAHTTGQTWVDVGCGTGHVLALVAPQFPVSLGLDLSPAMLRKAAARGLNVARSEAARLPLADDSVDVLSAFALLHHLFDPSLFFAEAFRVLRPGGILYTDYDPNVRPRRSNTVYRVMRSAYYSFSRLGRPSISSDPAAHAIAEVADYQMFNSRDFNGDTQSARLKAAGFSPANVIYHFNATSIFNPSEASRSSYLRGLIRTPVAEWFNMRFMADHFILLASKPRSGGPQ